MCFFCPVVLLSTGKAFDFAGERLFAVIHRQCAGRDCRSRVCHRRVSRGCARMLRRARRCTERDVQLRRSRPYDSMGTLRVHGVLPFQIDVLSQKLVGSKALRNTDTLGTLFELAIRVF